MTATIAMEQEILDAADERLVSLGSEAAQRAVEGKTSRSRLDQGGQILILRDAYGKASELTERERDAILHCLRYLSEAFAVPVNVNANVIGNLIAPLIPPP